MINLIYPIFEVLIKSIYKMKNWCTVFLVCLLFTACGDDIEFNYPALQANKDGVLWKSLSQEASNSSGMMIISGRYDGEEIKLELPINSSDTLFDLGADESSKATYLGENEILYSTLFSAVDDPTVYYSEGQIEIDDINTAEGFISGKFWFTAYDSTGITKVNFNQGVFYEVPFVNE